MVLNIIAAKIMKLVPYISVTRSCREKNGNTK